MAKTRIPNPVIDENAVGDENENLGEQQPQETAAERQEAHEIKMANIDREKIDAILLSDTVKKGGKIRIERRGPLDREFQYVNYIAAENFDSEGFMEWLKKLYGGGDYKCMTFRANGQLYKPFSFVIDHRFKGSLDDADMQRLASNKDTQLLTKVTEAMRANTPPPSDNGFKSADLIKMMEMGRDDSKSMMMLMMTMMQENSKSMVSMVAAAFGAKQTAPGLDPIVLELLKSKVNAETRTPMSEVLETMRAMKELNEPAPKDEKEEDMFDKIAKFAPMILPALTGQSAAQPIAPTVTSPPAQPQSTGAACLMDKLPMHVKIGVGAMFSAAARNADPAIYADMIYDQLGSNENWPVLKKILTEEDWKVKLFGNDRRIENIGPWLDELRDLLVADEPSDTIQADQAAGSESPIEQPGT